jgi:hypothetical protein
MSSSTDKSSHASRSLRKTARALGWFSIGLGLAELLAPRAMARVTGLAGRTTLMRAYGLREIATGIGLLASDNPRPWLWARVAGDALDALTLASGSGRSNPLAGHVSRAMKVAAAVGALDVAAASMPDRRAFPDPEGRFDYSDRVGMAKPAEAMRGAASDFMVPRDMRQPEPLRSPALH